MGPRAIHTLGLYYLRITRRTMYWGRIIAVLVGILVVSLVSGENVVPESNFVDAVATEATEDTEQTGYDNPIAMIRRKAKALKKKAQAVMAKIKKKAYALKKKHPAKVAKMKKKAKELNEKSDKAFKKAKVLKKKARKETVRLVSGENVVPESNLVDAVATEATEDTEQTGYGNPIAMIRRKAKALKKKALAVIAKIKKKAYALKKKHPAKVAKMKKKAKELNEK